MTDTVKAIGMYSGGLDSIIAHRLIAGLGVEVTALHFYTGFNGSVAREVEAGPGWTWTPPEEIVRGAEALGVKLLPVDVTDEYLDIILAPAHGYGSGVNPCIDCRIFLLGKAREVMEREGAAFVFTGEVLGQRPMSQLRPALGMVENRSGLKGRLLRPLSALLLPPTIPECEGIVDRGRLLGISGRSRGPQQKLAASWGIDWYPSSGGGCLLTDKSFTNRVNDLYRHMGRERVTLEALHSLKAGRHMRLPSGTKVIAGRNEAENGYLAALLDDGRWVFDSRDFPGSTVIAFDEPEEGDFAVIAAVCARYGKGRDEDAVAVVARRGDETRELTVRPADIDDIVGWLITER